MHKKYKQISYKQKNLTVALTLAMTPVISNAQFEAVLELSSLNGSNGFVLNGSEAIDFSGVSVSGAGDFNGDGIDDILIGARAVDSNGNNNAGASYVVFGKTTGFNSSFHLFLDLFFNSSGMVFNGTSLGEESGTSVSNAGDVNGIDDIIIGGLRADSNNTQESGASYVVFGSSDGFSNFPGNGFDDNKDLSALNGSNGFVVKGSVARDFSGRSVSAAGDINGDGIDDVVIGVPYSETSELSGAIGSSYVMFGHTGSFVASTNLSNITGSTGFVIRGIESYEYSGSAVSQAGDINGDGIDDLIIGANNANANGDYSGRTYVVFGKTSGFSNTLLLSTLNGNNGFILHGNEEGDHAGFSVSAAGDFNADGIDDVIIGSRGASNPTFNSGSSYVIFGKTSSFQSLTNLSDINGNNGVQIHGINANDGSGRTVSGAGDINGDGIDDIIIGARGADSHGDSTGASYIIFGKSTGFNNPINLSTLNGNNGSTINGVTGGDLSGWAVSSVGDVNGDGVDDVIIGAYRADFNGADFTGASYVVYGNDIIFANGFESQN